MKYLIFYCRFISYILVLNGLYFCRYFYNFWIYFFGFRKSCLMALFFQSRVCNVCFAKYLLYYLFFCICIFLTFTRHFLFTSIVYFRLYVSMLISRYIFIILFNYSDILMYSVSFIAIYQRTIVCMYCKIYFLLYFLGGLFFPFILLSCVLFFSG